MKKKISRILGVGLTVALLASLMLAASVACSSGAPSHNDVKGAVWDYVLEKRALGNEYYETVYEIEVVDIGRPVDMGQAIGKIWPAKVRLMRHVYSDSSPPARAEDIRRETDEREFSITQDPYGKWVVI